MGKILITGAAGFIGRALAERLLDRGEDLVLVDSLNNYYAPQLKRDRINTLMVGKKVKFFYADITNSDYLTRLFTENDIETVVHLAAQPGITASITDPGRTFRNNVEGTASILAACERHGVKRVFLASSSSVYGSTSIKGRTSEIDAMHPQNNYALSKVTNEHQARFHYERNGGTVAVMRFFTTYGPWGRPDMACWLFTDAIINNRPIAIRGENTARDFVYIDDLATMITKVIDNAPPTFMAYNLGSGSPSPVTEMVNCIGRALGTEPTIVQFELPNYEMRTTCAEMMRYQTVIGSLPDFTPLEDGIGEFVKWFKEYVK